ncbi:MAG: hypothetical protein AABY33_05545 [Pseudomonadota bacterium]
MGWEDYGYDERKPGNKPEGDHDDERIRKAPKPTKPTGLQEYLDAILKVRPEQNSGWNMIEGDGLAIGIDPEKIGKPTKHTEKLHPRLLRDNDKGGDGKDYCWRD